VIHGGTNFGYTAGANAFTPVQFQPDVTSYDYDAPINEQGRATSKYKVMRQLIAQYTDHPLPEPPAPIPVMTIPSISMDRVGTLWDHLPAPKRSPVPLPMEHFDQQGGMILYRTKLIGHKSGTLTITEPHDYALVFLNGQFIDTVYRDGGNWTVKLPKTDVKDPQLDILVEGMGHINFAQYMIDRKGITDRVTLNGMTLFNWEIYPLPLAAAPATTSAQRASSTNITATPQDKGVIFKGSFTIDFAEDTYFDLSGYKKGVIWVNGHCLGRYWYVGPQQHLYCPASWLKKGINEVVLVDLLQSTPAPIQCVPNLE
jgi:beta-galactosidase